MPGRDTVRELGAIMENFVTKGISVARDRIYRPVHEGGLGLILSSNTFRDCTVHGSKGHTW